MTYEELEGKAYLIATGSFLTHAFTYEEFMEMSDEQIFEYVWESLEHSLPSELVSLIVASADTIKEAFVEVCDEQKTL